MTKPDNGNHDDPDRDVGYQLLNSTQVCLIRSHERARIRGGFSGSRPIAILRESELRSALPCEEQRLILTKYKEEKSNILEKSNTVAAARRRQNAWQRITDCLNVQVTRNTHYSETVFDPRPCLCVMSPAGH